LLCAVQSRDKKLSVREFSCAATSPSECQQVVSRALTTLRTEELGEESVVGLSWRVNQETL
jgi:hypothetical protein